MTAFTGSAACNDAPSALASLGGTIASTAAIARRTLLRALRTPHVLTVGLLRSAMFLVLFRYVLGGAISSPVRYVDFLVPGFVAATVLFSGISSAVAVAEDAGEGVTERLRSLPVPRFALVAGRVLADTLLVGLGLLATAAVGFAVGFRTDATGVEVAGAFGVCLAAALAFTWVFVVLGLAAGSVPAAHGFALLVFPLAFVSSAFVPVDSMPAWIQPLAQHQPLTQLVDATRALALGPAADRALELETPTLVARSLLWSLGTTTVFAPLATLLYGRRR